MAAERDERSALVREKARVKSALDDLVKLKSVRQKRVVMVPVMVPASVTFTPPPPNNFRPPAVDESDIGYEMVTTGEPPAGRSSADLLRMQFGINVEHQETIQTTGLAEHDTPSDGFLFTIDNHTTGEAL